MKNLVQTSTTESKSNIIPIIKGIAIAYSVTFLLLFLFSILLTYTSINESTIAPVILMITTISILIGSSISSRKIKRNGLINGGMVGFFYIMMLYLISSFIQNGFGLNLYAILMIIFSILAGMIRGNCWCKPKKIIDKVIGSIIKWDRKNQYVSVKATRVRKRKKEEENEMEKIRGFEVANGYEESGIHLPVRKTKASAGYDIEAAEDCIIPSFKKGDKPTLVKTGIKAYMPEDEVLILANRSSNPGKKGLILANSIGVIDSDYYGNPDNDGHIMFAFYNIKEEDIQIKKGDAIGQGIFQKYLITDDDVATGERMGGFGSTSR